MKVYLLRCMENNKTPNVFRCAGIVSDVEIAKTWNSLSDNHVYYEYELNEKDIVNRIKSNKVKCKKFH